MVAFTVGSNEPFKLSRAKFNDFLECPRCFVLDRKHGISWPSGPGFTLNSAVDTLLKKEFDIYREAGEVHPFVKSQGLNLKPFVHPSLDDWRNSRKGLQHVTEDGHFLFYGAPDDVWVDDDGVLTVVDYKTTSRKEPVTEMGSESYYQSYPKQLECYQWLFRKNGFEVSSTAYWLYETATKKEDRFDETLKFETTLVAHEGDDSWIQGKLDEAWDVLNADAIPEASEECEKCGYFTKRQNLGHN